MHNRFVKKDLVKNRAFATAGLGLISLALALPATVRTLLEDLGFLRGNQVRGNRLPNRNTAVPSAASFSSSLRGPSSSHSTASPAPPPPDDPSQTMTLQAGDEEKFFPTKAIVKIGKVNQFKDSVERLHLTEKEIIRTGKIHSFKDTPLEKKEMSRVKTVTLLFREKPEVSDLKEEDTQKHQSCLIL